MFYTEIINEPFNQYMANPLQDVPICIINTECEPSLPIIQFKQSEQSTITKTTLFQNLTSTKLLCKRSHENTIRTLNALRNQYVTSKLIIFRETKTIHEIMNILKPLQSASKLYWLRFKVNLSTCQIGINENFDGIMMEILMAKRTKIARGEEKSEKTGLKYFFRAYLHKSSMPNEILTKQQENLIFKLCFDLGGEIKRRYDVQLSPFTFGFYYVNESEFISQAYVQYHYNGSTQNRLVKTYRDYIQYRGNIKPIKSIENFLKDQTNKSKYLNDDESRFYHGSWRIKGALTQVIASETYSKAKQLFEENPAHWHEECTDTRLKGFAKMRYYWKSKHSVVAKDLSKKEQKQAEKVAGGLRWFLSNPKDRIIPQFIKELTPCCIAVGAWDEDDEIDQASANLYFCPENATAPVFAELGCHNERSKFYKLTSIYINSSDAIKTGCAINLKMNASNGVVLVDTPHLEIIKWDSLVCLFFIY